MRAEKKTSIRTKMLIHTDIVLIRERAGGWCRESIIFRSLLKPPTTIPHPNFCL